MSNEQGKWIERGNGASVAASQSGGLAVVGCGIQFARHVSERCLSEIRHAEVLFCLVDSFALASIRQMRPDVINLGVHYAVGKDRRETYREIDAAIMAEVRRGKRTCAVFYGHPGVFADVPHRVVRQARAEGFPAHMEPGISAEACLYADLGLDPGNRGVQSMEATHLMFYDRDLDPRGLVLLWQVALSGDLTCSRFQAEREGLQMLVERLLRWYPSDHPVILYEAAQLPVQDFRAEQLTLRELPEAQYEEFTTLVIPPLGELHGRSDQIRP